MSLHLNNIIIYNTKKKSIIGFEVFMLCIKRNVCVCLSYTDLGRNGQGSKMCFLHLNIIDLSVA